MLHGPDAQQSLLSSVCSVRLGGGVPIVMNYILIILLVISFLVNVYLLKELKDGSQKISKAISLLDDAHESIKFWKLLAMSKIEGIEKILNTIDFDHEDSKNEDKMIN